MLRQFCTSTLAIAAALAFAAPSYAASTLTGTVTEPAGDAAGWTGTFNVNQSSSDLASMVGGSYQIICIDYSTHFPDFGDTHSYSFSTALTGSEVSHASSAARATDLINWAVDHYYDSQMVHGVDSSFNVALWEITRDFNGTAASLNTNTGNLVTDYGSAESTINEIRANYDAIALGYRSTQYTVSFLDDTNSNYQNMVMLSALPTAPVPEPSTFAMLAAGGLVMGALRRRRMPR